jgi:hypothetical protein
MLENSPALYLARRDAYAAFLSAADAESNVAWFRQDGRYEDRAAEIAAVDRAYGATRAAFNVIDVEGVGPLAEAREVLVQLAALHKDDGTQGDWKGFKAAREAFVDAARTALADLRA